MPYEQSSDTNATNSQHHKTGLGSKGSLVVPSDTVDFSVYPKAVCVISSGDLTVLPARNDDGDTVTFAGAPIGFIPPFRVRRVLSTNTTAAVCTVFD